MVAKRRIYEIAKEQGLTTQELVDLLRASGLEVKSNLSSVEDADADRVLAAAVKPAAAAEAADDRKAASKPSAKAASKSAAKPAAKPAAEPSAKAKKAAATPEEPLPEPSATRADGTPQYENASAETAPAGEAAPSPEPKPKAGAKAAAQPPRPVGPKVVATAAELKAKEEAAAAARSGKDQAQAKGARPRGRGPRLDDLPTVVGPGVPLRKGVKPSGTVHKKGEEPSPKPVEKPAPAPGRPGARPGGPPSAGKPGTDAAPAGPPRPPAAGRPVAGRPAGAPPRPAPVKDEREAAARTGAKRRSGTPSAPYEPGSRMWRGDDKQSRRRVVIDSQAGRRSGKAAAADKSGAVAEVERAAVKIKPAPGTESPVTIASGSTVKDVADALELPPTEIIKTLMRLGEMATITQSLADETVVILAEELERQVEVKHAEEETEEPTFVDDPADLLDRPPVVTIMGHVDHGKTSLLDAIRETEVVKSEAGGITQHIGAYQVSSGERLITFIDTPGHEAFTAMRARGAKVTDLAVIVVAANDGVMPQTIEAIDHAKAAEVPMVVAVNKIDLADANPDRVKQQLSEQGLVPEAWGGDTVMVEVSAKQRLNLDDLLEMILLVTEVQELKANPTAEASGVVIEAQLDVGRGPVATMLVQRGTLRVGDALWCGEAFGKVKAMFDFKGTAVMEAGPAMPVQILGFNTVPVAGDLAVVAPDEREARHRAEARSARLRMEREVARARGAGPASLDDFYLRLKDGAVKELALIIKGDVGGSVEALQEALGNISHPEVKVRVIHSGVGGINESDVTLAAASGAVVIGFNVRPSTAAKGLAESEGVDIRTYRVIYKAIEDVEAALVGLLEPEQVEEELGAAEVRQLFRSSKVGVIAGSYVQSGKITRSAKVRLVRDGSIVHEGTIDSLRRFEEDAREVLAGFECGIHLEGFDDVHEGDIIEAYEIREVARTQ